MKNVILGSAVALVALGSGCAIPFDGSGKGESKMEFGANGDCTASGEKEEDGNVTTWSSALDANDANICVITIESTGKFLDTAKIKSDVEKSLEGSPLAGSEIVITVEELSLKVTETKLIDGDTDLTETLAADIISYDSSTSADDIEGVLEASASAADGNLAEPKVTTDPDKAEKLRAAVNEALAAGKDINGSSVGHVRFSMTNLPTIAPTLNKPEIFVAFESGLKGVAEPK